MIILLAICVPEAFGIESTFSKSPAIVNTQTIKKWKALENKASIPDKCTREGIIQHFIDTEMTFMVFRSPAVAI